MISGSEARSVAVSQGPELSTSTKLSILEKHVQDIQKRLQKLEMSCTKKVDASTQTTQTGVDGPTLILSRKKKCSAGEKGQKGQEEVQDLID